MEETPFSRVRNDDVEYSSHQMTSSSSLLATRIWNALITTTI